MYDRALAEIDPTLIEDLVDANRILYHLGVVDGFGHASVRDPEDPSRFIISRSMAPALVTADDLMAIRLDGRPVSDNAPTPYLERFIHGEIYAARPDVVAVVHSHSASIIPFTIVPEATLKPVSHMSGFIGEGAPVFEIRDTAGLDNDMLVRSPELGKALAKSLGNNNIVLMRGHGSTVVGFNLRQAVYRAVYAEVNARQQSEALRMGTPIYLTPGEAVGSAKANDGQQDRAWNLWKRAIEGSGLA
jgi:HCOMODA/2-hydroxy-3-carboxy-muconic semialdehyde decarboxylase